MARTIVLVTLVALMAAGCAVPPAFTAVPAGPVAVGGLQVTPKTTWNRASRAQAPFTRQDAEVWTQDGLLLNRLIIIPAVPDGQPIFAVPSKTVALPAFRADMLPNEIEELTESSMVKMLGEGSSTVETANLRPLKFGERRGLMFDFTGQLADGPEYRGVVGAFIADDQLYMIIYFGAEPYYYGKHLDEAESIIRSARS